MTLSELQISYRPDDQWSGEIVAVVRSGAFSAEGSAFFSPEHVKETFVPQLRSYPLDPLNPPTLEGGIGKHDRGGFAECHLRIVIKPYDARGTLLVYVELAADHLGPRSDGPHNRAMIHFLAEYAAIDVFAEHLEQVLSGQRETAILQGI